MRELGVALVGGGFMGKAHSAAYALADRVAPMPVRLAPRVLVDVDASTAAAQASALGWPEWSVDLDEVLARADVDIVDVCTPPHLHEQIVTAALAAGKHVLCEKPITNDAASAERLAAAAAASGVVAQIGFNYRHAPALTFARRLIEQGRLGAPLQLRGSYLQETAFWADPTRWRARRSSGGSGMVGDIGSHVIDIAQMLLGDISRVSAIVRGRPTATGWDLHALEADADQLDDAGAWIAEFESGAIGAFTIDAFAVGHKNHLEIAVDGTEGGLEFDWNRREELRVAYVDDVPDHRGFRTISMSDVHPDGWWRVAGLGTGYADVMAVQVQRLASAIADGSPAGPSFQDALQAQRVVDAIVDSARSRSWVDVRRRDA